MAFRRKTSKTTPWRCETLSFRGGEDARGALCFVFVNIRDSQFAVLQ